LDLPSLVYRRYRGDMIEVYKLPMESTHLVIVCYQGLHSQIEEDMISNWWNDVATHS